jgi:hypothetical protein
LITCYVLFHLTNHLFGLLGPETHAAIMKAGRVVYRAPLIEPVLVLALLFQASSGVRLAWHWSRLRTDAYRVFQIGSGVYLAAFLLAHLNSGLIAARHVYKIETNWAWASGAPEGLIHGAWNIRLLPHYALGVFFILAHLASGFRVVMIAHDVNVAIANRVRLAGLTGAALISTVIILRAMRRADLARRRLICSSRQFCGSPVQPPLQKYFLFSSDPNHRLILFCLVPGRGALAIVTNVGRGMRWTRQRRRAFWRGRTMLTRTAKSCGPDAPTLASRS